MLNIMWAVILLVSFDEIKVVVGGLFVLLILVLAAFHLFW